MERTADLSIALRSGRDDNFVVERQEVGESGKSAHKTSSPTKLLLVSPSLATRMEEPRILLRGRYPEGPGFAQRLFSGEIFRLTAAGLMLRNAQRYGDLNHFTGIGRHIFQFNHPQLIEELLLRDAARHHRGLVMQRAKLVLGEGLLTSEAPLHLRQRRLAQPAFHRQRIAAYGNIIAGYAEEMTSRWESGKVVDLQPQMLLLALRIVGKTLFDTNVEEDVHQIAEAVDSFMGFLFLAFLPFPELTLRLPLPVTKRIRRGQKYLDDMIYRMIAERRKDPRDRGDLLSMLLAAVDNDEGTGGMSDRQVRDECVTVMLAGHETTANALSFAMWELARNPDVQERLYAECRAVLGRRTPSADDYSKLAYAALVFAEVLRLYPPVWVTARTAVEDYEYRGIVIPKGAILLAPQIVAHRDERFWDRPLEFDPLRFTEENKSRRPRFSYFPFGAGTRQCIGEGLAWMEGVLVLASIARDWKLSLPSGAPAELPLWPAISLRPKDGVLLRIDRRPS
jgi:cytochrome P450